ncbi:hypothetical protein EV426DRAFT_119417 [Tirmania nivea]|nr:hypothetical protein EV426DRAFT_119417 [Tirmania nivea]
MESSSPPNRTTMHPNHARSSSTNLPRLSSSSRIPLSPTRSSTTGPFGLSELTENLRYSGPPPPYGAATQAHAALGNITQTTFSSSFSASKIANSDMDSLKMPPPSKVMTSLKGRSMSINNTDASKRETLAERAGRPSGIVPPGSARSTASGGITKPGSRSTSIAPGTVNRQHTLPRPKSSMERVRPPSFSSTNGSLFRSSQSKPSSVSGGSRPPSAQDMRPASAIEDDSDGSSKEAMLVWQQMQKRLAELEEKFQKDQEEKEKNAANNAGDSWKEKYDAERIKVMELETARAGIESQLSFAKMELEQTKQNLMSLQHALEEERRDRRAEKDDASRRLDREVEEVKRRTRDEMDSLIRSHREAMESVERNAKEAQESEIRRLKQDLEDEKAARRREVSETQTQAALEKQKLETKMDSKWREIRQMKEELESIGRELERERLMNAGLRQVCRWRLQLAL